MFSRTLEYALRAAAHLALSAPELVTVAQMAEATQVPGAYLSKVLQQLRDHGIIVTQRGIGGGMKLARPAAELTILDIADAVDPIARIRTCPLGITGHGDQLCPLHRRLDHAMALIEKTFAESTLADLVDDKQSIKPLCPFPQGSARKG